MLVLSFSIRVIQRTGVNSAVPVYVVGVFSGDKMLAEGKRESITRVVIISVKVKNPIPPTRRSTHHRHTTDASVNTVPRLPK